MNRKQRAELAKHHVEFNTARKEYPRSQTKTYTLAELETSTELNTEKSTEQATADNHHIAVTKEGCIQACRRLYDNHQGTIGLLNFASAKHAGGGFLNGSLAQEEDICLKTDLYHYIKQESDFYNTATHAKQRGYYKDELMYSTGVQIIRDEDYALLEHYIDIDVVTCPAPNRSVESLGVDMAQIGLENRINMIIQAFAEHGCHHIVLGAFGCGVFRNEPTMVAELFANALEKYAYSELQTVIFAIKTNNDNDPNYKAFVERFL